MKFRDLQKGQSLVEILFAIAVFTIGVVTIGYLIFESFSALQHNLHATQARLLAREGLQAASFLRNSIEPGAYGLSYEEGVWAFVSSPDVVGGFTRSVQIEQIDLEVYEVISTVTWGSVDEVENIVVLSTLISNWKQSRGDAPKMDIDINNAALVSSSTSLTGIALLNNSPEDLTIDAMVVQFDPAASLLAITIRGVEVFSAASSSAISTGEYIDIPNYVVGSATGYHMVDPIEFDRDMQGGDFLLTFIMDDGSRRHVLVPL